MRRLGFRRTVTAGPLLSNWRLHYSRSATNGDTDMPAVLTSTNILSNDAALALPPSPPMIFVVHRSVTIADHNA